MFFLHKKHCLSLAKVDGGEMTVMVIGGEENDGDDGPPVGGERAGLVRADRRRVAHRLARVQVPHQVVVAHHFL